MTEDEQSEFAIDVHATRTVYKTLASWHIYYGTPYVIENIFGTYLDDVLLALKGDKDGLEKGKLLLELKWKWLDREYRADEREETDDKEFREYVERELSWLKVEFEDG